MARKDKYERGLYDKRYNLKRYYGITLEEYNLMLEKQEGRCAICLKPESMVRNGVAWMLSVDHDPITKKVRGLLCNSCNVSIGRFNHDVEALRRAIEYLEQP